MATGKRAVLGRRYALALAGLLAAGLPFVGGQTPGTYNEHEIDYKKNLQDPDKEKDLFKEKDLWVLKFRFKDPRLITAEIPGRGRKLCWYLWYQVINTDTEPRTFIPEFDLVTYDKPQVFHDQVLPAVQDAIRKVEDPTRHLDIKNSVTISAEPIPPAKPDSIPKPVTGVAIWDDIDPDASRYSIFVTGLSNGWSVDDKEVIRRKTLQLNFRRLGDRYYQDAREIRFVAPHEWIYRASALHSPDSIKAPATKEK